MAPGDGQEVAWLDDLVDQITGLHDLILEESGGLAGLRGRPILYSACARPFHTFDDTELYPQPLQKAAAIFHAIVCDHPFVDGNKRTATLAGIYMLVGLDYIDMASRLQVRFVGDLAIETAQGTVTTDEVAFWFNRIFEPPQA